MHRNRTATVWLAALCLGGFLPLTGADAAPARPAKPAKKAPVNPAPAKAAPAGAANPLEKLIEQQLGMIPGLNPAQQAAAMKQVRKALAGLVLPAGMPVKVMGIVTTIQGDDVTTQHKTDSTTITVTGKLVKGKCQPTKIEVKDDGGTKTYKKVGDVPAKHRAKVKDMIDKALPPAGLGAFLPVLP
jgi:hypothetical protein